MAKREYIGDPIDLTDGPGEKHLSDSNGETVGGTTDDDMHTQEIDSWPSALDRDDFTELQAEIVEKLSLHSDSADVRIAEMVGCTKESVRQVRHKVSALAEPDSVQFDVPDEPKKTIKIVKSTLDDSGNIPRENGTEAGDTSTTNDSGNGDTGETKLSKEKIAELYEDGLSPEEIADRVGAEKSRIIGMKGILTRQGLIGDSDKSTEDEEQTNTSATEGSSEPTESESDGSDTDDSSDSTTPTISLSVEQLLEILEARNVSTETKQDILQQGDF